MEPIHPVAADEFNVAPLHARPHIFRDPLRVIRGRLHISNTEGVPSSSPARWRRGIGRLVGWARKLPSLRGYPGYKERRPNPERVESTSRAKSFGNYLAIACASLALAATASAASANEAPPAKENPAPPPDRQELWVPANRLKDILKKHPNAVMLSREEYETLLKDAKREKDPELIAPRRAAFSAARYQARVVDKTVLISATLTVNVLSDEWAEVPLDFAEVTLSSLQVDGEAALLHPTFTAKGQPAVFGRLLLRGRGERVVRLEFARSVGSVGGSNQLHCRLPSSGAGIFELTLPPKMKVESPQPIRVSASAEATLVTAGLTPQKPELDLRWQNAGVGDQSLEPLVSASGVYKIDAARLFGQFGISVETQLGHLASTLEIGLPGTAKVSEVVGDDVAAWEVADGRLRVNLLPGQRTSTKLWMVFEAPSLGDQAAADLVIPVPKFEGMKRIKGVISIVGDEGVVVKGIKTDATLQPSDRTAESASNFVASYQFNAAPTSLTVAVEKAVTRFSTDLDTRVEFQPDAIRIERTVTLHQERGEVFQLAMAIPPGEELIDVIGSAAGKIDWRVEEGKLRIRWSHAPGDGALKFFISTRAEPAKWTQLDAAGLNFALGDLKIDGVDKVTGYVALTASEAFRLEATPSETMERRDGRTTPIKGDYAWFRGKEFSLAVRITKRPVEILSSLVGYALPLEGFLDLQAQINYQFLHSGARSVRIQVPEKLASQFYFDGPQIAERNLNGDTWTIVFQKELTGNYALKVSAQVPVDKAAANRTAAGGDDASAVVESQFQVAVPVITPLDVVRTSGVWAIEANTETEIHFAAKGMNELDSLLAPPMAEYQPRQRVIGVFAWLGKDYSLSLTGVRHASAAMITTIADALELETVVSTSGLERNQAVYRLRNAGAQYLDVELPKGSRLLSLTVDRELVKPVGDRPELVRVPLSVRRDPSYVAAITLLYETPGGEWKRRGGYAARAPRLAKDIPVLRSMWRLYLPEGFDYTDFASNLRVPTSEIVRPLLLSPLSLYDEWRLKRVFDVFGRSGMVDPSTLDQELSPRLAAEGRRRLALVAEQEETLNQFLLEAQSFYDSGRYELAKKRCEQILQSKPGHQEARQILQKIQSIAPGPAQQVLTESGAADRLVSNEAPVQEERPPTEVIQRKLDRIIIPKLEFREATIREAIDFLRKKSQEFDQDGAGESKGVNITLRVENSDAARMPTNSAPATITVPGMPGFDAIPSPNPASVPTSNPEARGPLDARITVSLTSIPLREALKYVTSLANLKFRVTPYGVSVVPLSENTETLVTKEWTLPPDLIPRLPSSGNASGIADRESSKSWLIGNGVTFNGQASSVYIVRTNRLIVRDTQENIDMIDTIITANTRTPEPERPSADDMVVEQGANASSLSERISRKLNRIIIPKLEFRESTLREALDFLRKKSQDLDVDSPVGEKGINVVLKLAEGELPAAPRPPMAESFPNPGDSRITVSLTNVPLHEALKYVTSLANVKFKVEPYAVVVVPLSENTEVFMTREWKVPKDLIPVGGNQDVDTTRGGGADSADREGAKNWLIANGVTFNGKSTAVYVARSSRLIVRNTEDQLDLIDTIIRQESAPPETAQQVRAVDAGLAERINRKLDRIVIPKLEFREATVREAVDTLRKKSQQLDLDSPIGERGVNIILKLEGSGVGLPGLPPPDPAPAVPGIPGLDPIPMPANTAPLAFTEPADARITVSLTNIPLREALKYVTSLANLKFKVEPYAVSIVPLSENTEVLVTREWKILPDLIPRTPGVGGAAGPNAPAPTPVVPDRESSKNWLIANGVTFNGAASAVYNPRTGSLIVRNTPDQLELIDTITSAPGSNAVALTPPPPRPQAYSRATSPPPTRPSEPARVVGALPMKLDLPKVGRMVEFEGFEAADKIEFQYDDWWSRARRLWMWFVGGGLLALALAGARPWWRSCWVALLLTFIPYCVSMTASPVCDALLAGWLVSVILQRLAVRLVFAPRRKEVLA